MSELSNWEKISKTIVGSLSSVLVLGIGAVAKGFADSAKNTAKKNALDDANLHLNSMSKTDKIFHKSEYKYWQSKRDNLKK